VAEYDSGEGGCAAMVVEIDDGEPEVEEAYAW
jgi:hypothetical protein